MQFYVRSFDIVALNPQPIPPRVFSRFDWVLLNPQPLPPKAFYRYVRFEAAIPVRAVRSVLGAGRDESRPYIVAN
ncbi:MAG: hypothetical protein ACRDJ9_34035, partial [Dehalococcoidia bacterium]